MLNENPTTSKETISKNTVFENGSETEKTPAEPTNTANQTKCDQLPKVMDVNNQNGTTEGTKIQPIIGDITSNRSDTDEKKHDETSNETKPKDTPEVRPTTLKAASKIQNDRDGNAESKNKLNITSSDTSSEEDDDSDEEEPKQKKRRTSDGPIEELRRIQTKNGKWLKKSFDYVTDLQQQLCTEKEKYATLVSSHQKEKANLTNEVQKLKEEVNRLRKATKDCTYCSKPIESISFCNKFCYNNSVK